MFDKIPETRSMSEPWATVVAHVNYNGGLISHQGTDYEEIIKACIRIQCKPEKKSYIKRIFYKQATWASAQVLIIYKLLHVHPFQYIPCHTLLKQYTDYPTLTCGYGMTNLYTDLLFIRNILSNNATSTSHS